MRLAGKVAIVTGGGSGLGQATAKLFAREGAKVIVADVADAGGGATAREIEAAGGEALFLHTNVRDSADVKRAVDTAEGTYGKLNIMVGVLHSRLGAAQVGFEYAWFVYSAPTNWSISTGCCTVFLYKINQRGFYGNPNDVYPCPCEPGSALRRSDGQP